MSKEKKFYLMVGFLFFSVGNLMWLFKVANVVIWIILYAIACIFFGINIGMHIKSRENKEK